MSVEKGRTMPDRKAIKITLPTIMIPLEVDTYHILRTLTGVVEKLCLDMGWKMVGEQGVSLTTWLLPPDKEKTT